MNDWFKVAWSKTAIKEMSQLFNINHRNIFIKSKYLLSQEPRKKAYGIIDYPDKKT